MQNQTYLYNEEPAPPFQTANRQMLSDEIQQINYAFKNLSFTSSPHRPIRIAKRALSFLMKYNTAIYGELGKCAWSYACAPTPTGALPWHTCVSNLTKVIRNAIEHPNVASNYAIARDNWAKFTLAVQSGCNGVLPDGNRGARWMIKQTPNGEPFFGRTVCMPTPPPPAIPNGLLVQLASVN